MWKQKFKIKLRDKDSKSNFWRTKNQKQKFWKQNLIPSLGDKFQEQTFEKQKSMKKLG
jgi:hypothetical protein